MARVTVEDCLERNIDGRFALVHLAVRRVVDLRRGAVPMVNAPKNKDVVVALREIASGKVTLNNVKNLVEQIEETPKPSAASAKTTQQELKEIVDEATAISAEAAMDDGQTEIEEDFD